MSREHDSRRLAGFPLLWVVLFLGLSVSDMRPPHVEGSQVSAPILMPTVSNDETQATTPCVGANPRLWQPR